MASGIDEMLRSHLIRGDKQEDLAFALWTPSHGSRRLSALVHTPMLPVAGDRQVHGNTSFNLQYFERACHTALVDGFGIAFLHSHPFPGWQDMSRDDIDAELSLAGSAGAITGLPLLGMTVGDDGTWSARVWEHRRRRSYRRTWCASVRVVGPQLAVSFADRVLPHPGYREQCKRTVTVWGEAAHTNLVRLRIGIVGLGSVGSLVAESLARMGFTRFVLIDFDHVESHNLDRLVTAKHKDVGRLKVEVAKRRVRAVATAKSIEIHVVPYSVVEEPGYRAALDCDVIFSCVDRPRARHILNHLAFAHLIPVIDGGIAVRFKHGGFAGVDWQLQTVGPGRPCLECLGVYQPGDVSTEEAGKLDDPSYMEGLEVDHRFKRNENVFPFSTNLASLEVLQLIALATGAGGLTDFGVQRYRYFPGILEQESGQACRPECARSTLVGLGDHHFSLVGRDRSAERTREASPAHSS